MQHLGTVKDAAKICGCTEEAIYQRLGRGTIQGHREGGRWKIDLSSLDRKAPGRPKAGAASPTLEPEG